jgi:hypothetical protein
MILTRFRDLLHGDKTAMLEVVLDNNDSKTT